MTSHITSRWTSEQDDLLRANYLQAWPILLSLFPERRQAGIAQRMRVLGLTRPKPAPSFKRWTPDEIEYLKTHYGRIPLPELIKYLGRTEHTINQYAHKRGIRLPQDCNGRTINTRHKPTLAPLLNGSLQSAYWMGYLMADGYMHHPLNQVVLTTADEDVGHLWQFAQYLNASVKRYIGHNPWGPGQVAHNRVSVADKIYAPKLVELLDWRKDKTYNPPSIDVLKTTLEIPNVFLAFLIGFIDGDGSINKDSHGIRVENHASWILFHNFLLKNLCDFGSFDLDIRAKINTRGYADFNLPNGVTRYLKSFINQHQLIVLSRKWDQVSLSST